MPARMAKRSQLAIATALIASCGHAALATSEKPSASVEPPETCRAGEDGKSGPCPSAAAETLTQVLAEEASSLLQTRREVADVSAQESFPEPEEDLDDILHDLLSDPVISPVPGNYATTACHLDDPLSNGCKLSSMSPGKIYDVYPGAGSGAACLKSSSPFYFQVRKGPESAGKEKLMIYFQGGGACWDFASYTIGICLKKPVATDWEGIMSNTHADNPYRDYTIVHILYCSGDMFIGDTSHRWSLKKVQQRGYHNANSAISWATEQFDSSLSRLALVGCSAGSLGAQFWSDYLLNTFKAKFSLEVSTLVADSFVGVLHPLGRSAKLEGKIFRKFGACETPIFPPTVQALCDEKKLTLDEFMLGVMERHPSTQFTMVNSKADKIQRAFEQFYALTSLDIPGVFMTAADYYKDVNLILERYRALENFWVYLVNTNQHCYTCYDLFWTTTPMGPESYPLGSPALGAWSASFVDGSSNEPPVICEGEPKPVTKDTPSGKSTDYCSSNILPP